jgi:hypothetical protein
MLGLNDGATFPKSIWTVGYKHPETMNDAPSAMTTIFEYDKYHVEWSLQVTNLYNCHQGVAWIGNNATLVCNRQSLQLIPHQRDRNGNPTIEPIHIPNPPTEDVYDDGLPAQTKNWLECIRSNNIQTDSPLEKGVFATILGHCGNISYRTGAKLTYNGSTQKFVNNPAADALLKPSYRSPWDSMWR